MFKKLLGNPKVIWDGRELTGGLKLNSDGEDKYAGRHITGGEFGVFNAFGLLYSSEDTQVSYQKPAAHCVNVCFDQAWLVLCSGPSRSEVAIASDHIGSAESFGPSITYMPSHCDIRVREDENRTSDIILIAPPARSFEEALELRGMKSGSMNYFWTEAAESNRIIQSLRQTLLDLEIRRNNPLRIDSAVEQVVTCLVDLYAREANPASRSSKLGLTRRNLRAVSDFVDCNLERTITLESMANVVGLSKHHFARKFRAATGASAYDHVLTKRLLRAMAYLADTGLPIAEVAVTCGFFDHAHMSRHFGRRVGVQPARYRQIMQM